MTLAQQAAAYITALGWTVPKVAMFTQVDQTTVRRWLREAEANDKGGSEGFKVEASRVLHLQSHYALAKLAPGLSLRLTTAMPEEWFAEVAQCVPVRLPYERTPEEIRRLAVVRDGAGAGR